MVLRFGQQYLDRKNHHPILDAVICILTKADLLVKSTFMRMLFLLLISPAFSADSSASTSTGKKKVVRIFLPGGMTHMDSFDPKPQTPELMGNTKAIKTNTGEEISGYFPMTAKRMDRIALIRSMVSPEGDHQRGRYLLETSYPLLGTIKHPCFGAWMQRINGVQNDALPPSVNIRSGLARAS